MAHQREAQVPQPQLPLPAVVGNFIREIPRGALNGYPAQLYTPVLGGTGIYNIRTPRSTRACVEDLTEASDRGVVEMLMRPHIGSNERLAYNFSNFTDHRYMAERRKRTIEFRQTAGSVDPDVVVNWGRTYVKMCRFAIDSSHRQFWRVVHRPIDADPLQPDQDNAIFDVFDLLCLVNLDDEAMELQRGILARRFHEAQAVVNDSAKEKRSLGRAGGGGQDVNDGAAEPSPSTADLMDLH